MEANIELCQRPIFVLGAPRSGTTALAWALAQHSQLWTSGESYVLWELFGGERGDRGINQILQTADVLATGSWLSKEGVTRKELLSALGLGVNALFTTRSHPKRWIDHTPVQSLMAETLGEMFPDALFLHSLRDGRKVVHSMIHFREALEPEVRANFEKARWNIPWLDFTEACRTWCQYAESVKSFEAANPSRCMTVMHDDLISDTAGCFSRIFEFIGVPFEEQPVHFIQTRRLHSSFHGDSNVPERERSSAWVDWTPEQRAIFVREAGEAMVRFGMAAEADFGIGVTAAGFRKSRWEGGGEKSASKAKWFDKLKWEDDHVISPQTTFFLAGGSRVRAVADGTSLNLWKTRPQLDYYRKFWSSQMSPRVQNVFEIGIGEGGSLAFWFECLQPARHVAIDIRPKEDAPDLSAYVKAHALEGRLKAYWGVDQSDAARLREIVDAEYSEPLDVVIDDASHLYAPTKASFEALFPRLRTGGIYIIEAWAWAYNPTFQDPGHPWAKEKPLADLVHELEDLAGSSGWVASIIVNKCFVAIERGHVAAQPGEPFAIARHITRSSA